METENKTISNAIYFAPREKELISKSALLMGLSFSAFVRTMALQKSFEILKENPLEVS